MHRNSRIVFLAGVMTFAFAGCESHQAKVDALQKEHDRISQQYKQDCGAEYLKAKPQFSQKCIDEAKHTDDVWKQLQAERSK